MGRHAHALMAVGKGWSRRYESETGVQALSATVPRLR